MTNKFYAPGEQRAARVNDLFAAVAPRYDLINDLQSFGLHRRWKRRLVWLARVKPGDRALDLCCGTGDIAFALAARGAAVIGLDSSKRMLAIAEKRKAKVRKPSTGGALAQVEFLRGDAQQLPLPDGSFDIVTVGYGLRNLPSWEAGLGEMQRVARPGARLLVLDFGKPDYRPWRWLYFNYLRLFVPMLGRIVCSDAAAYAYILESLKHYPAQRGVAAKMRESGLVRVRVENLLGGAMSINYSEKAQRDEKLE
jgi:demethylmenaquinone methyltransferase/2-methoxy-6-polyprenyl-1,4-benzoquinol methylase